MWRIDIQYRSVIKRGNDGFIDDFFKIAEIHHHTEFHMIGVSDRCSQKGYREFVAVAVYIFTQSVITVQGMARFKLKLFCYSNYLIHLFYSDLRIFCVASSK